MDSIIYKAGDKMDMMALLDFLTFPLGAYLVYMGVSMKLTGAMKSKLLLSKNVDLNKAVDLPGYIAHTYLANIILGVLLILYGTYSLYLVKDPVLAPYQLYVIILVFIVIMVYAVYMMKAQRKFIEGKE